jgi:hypothetical protein
VKFSAVKFRALLRRAFPYLVIAVAGFAIAYVVVFTFVLPTKLVPSKEQPYVPDTSELPLQGDTGVQPLPPPVTVAPPAGIYTPSPAPIPVDVPDLVGMALPDARGVLNTLQLNTAVERDTSSIQPPNTVIHQSPEAGAKVSAHGTVTLTASYFPSLPDSGKPQGPESLPPITPEPDTGAQ